MAFCIILYPPSHIAFHQEYSTSPHQSLYITRYPHPLQVWYVIPLEFAPTLYPLASAACLCALRRMPTSASMYRISLPPPPLAALGLIQGPCWSLGGRQLLVPTSTLFPCISPSLCNSPLPIIFWYLVSAQVAFFVCKGEGPGHLLFLVVALPEYFPPPANFPYWSRSYYHPTPPPYPWFNKTISSQG